MPLIDSIANLAQKIANNPTDVIINFEIVAILLLFIWVVYRLTNNYLEAQKSKMTQETIEKERVSEERKETVKVMTGLQLTLERLRDTLAEGQTNNSETLRRIRETQLNIEAKIDKLDDAINRLLPQIEDIK